MATKKKNKGGRKTISPDGVKLSERVQLLFRPDEKELFEKVARDRGFLTINHWARFVLTREANEE